MTSRSAVALLLLFPLCAPGADVASLGNSQYGDASGAVTTHTDRSGRIATLEAIKIDEGVRLGVGTVAGAVAGGLIGSQVSDGSRKGAVVGAATGAAIGSYADSRLAKRDAQRVTVAMATGGVVTIVQPVDTRLANGMDVRLEGSGESARVVPR